MVGKKEYTTYFRMIPYIQPGAIRDAMEKESKKFKAPTQASSNISPKIQSQSLADVQRQLIKSQSASSQIQVKELQAQIEWHRVQQREAVERTAQLKSEMKRTDIEAIKTKAKMQSNLKTQETLEQERRKQSGAESAIYRERGVQLERTKGVSARRAEAQKNKELNKYNGMSLSGIANKLLSEKIQTSLTNGLEKTFTGSQGAALSGALGKSIIAGVSTAAAGGIIAVVAAVAAALVALMVAPFKLILSLSQKAFNFLKGIATQTETFKKLMELVMMPFMLMFTLLFAPVLMALAPILTSVIQAIVAKQDAIMAVGANIATVIEKLFNEEMIETFITLIDQVVSVIDWFVGVVESNLTMGNSIFETIILTFTKVMHEVLVAIIRWAYGPEGMAIIKELAFMIGDMIGAVTGFVITMLPAMSMALGEVLKGIINGLFTFFGDLIIAGLSDVFGDDSDIVTAVKNFFGFIYDLFSGLIGFLENPVGSIQSWWDSDPLGSIQSWFSEGIDGISKSFDNLLTSTSQVNQTTSISKETNVDNTHISFGDIGSNSPSAIDALTASMRLNGVI